jgi:MYND finger
MEDLLMISPHLHLFNEIHTEYFRLTAMACQEDLAYEELYDVLFRDVSRHPSIYFQVIFGMNDIYAERCSLILCTYADILRKKGKIKKCQTVLQLLQHHVLKAYQATALPLSGSVSVPSSASNHRPQRPRQKRSNPSQIQCCKALTYKFNDIRIDINSTLGIQETAVQALREACLHELEQQFGFEQQTWLVVLFSIVGPSYQESITCEKILNMADEVLWQALLLNSRSITPLSGPTYDVNLQKCHGCDLMETSRGDFEECSNCLRVYYCCHCCQARHWKIHKKECFCANTTTKATASTTLVKRKKRALSFVPWRM